MIRTSIIYDQFGLIGPVITIVWTENGVSQLVMSASGNRGVVVKPETMNSTDIEELKKEAIQLFDLHLKEYLAYLDAESKRI